MFKFFSRFAAVAAMALVAASAQAGVVNGSAHPGGNSFDYWLVSVGNTASVKEDLFFSINPDGLDANLFATSTIAGVAGLTPYKTFPFQNSQIGQGTYVLQVTGNIANSYQLTYTNDISSVSYMSNVMPQQAAAVPEPGTLALLASGLLLLAFATKRSGVPAIK